MSDTCNYDVQRATMPTGLQGRWDSAAWGPAGVLAISSFHERSSDHRPCTRAKLLYDESGLYALFDVQDRYVRCVHEGFQKQVCQDSCVELFVEPPAGAGYINFEVSAGGALLAYHIIDPARRPEGFAKFTVLPDELLAQVRIYHSLPARVEPELAEPTNWQIELAIPWTFFEAILGPTRPSPGTRWRGNLYKCADHSSHPHWASWSPVGVELNFHRPDCFGTLTFR